MRGFHLYAVLLGSLMVAITVAYSVFLGYMEHSKVSLILEMEKRARFIPVTDIIREESFSAVSVVFRRSFQYFVERFALPLSEEYLRSGDEEEFAESVFKDDFSVKTLASYMYAELRSYTAVSHPGREVELIGGPATLEEAIREGFDLKLREDSVILIFDPRKLSPSIRESLPKLRVCEAGYCRELLVFPEEKVEVTIPLRLKKALEEARKAYRYLLSRKNDLTLMAGFCRESCAICGVFNRWGEVVYPPVKESYCEGFTMNLTTFLDKSGYYRATGIEGGGCKNLSVLIEEENRYLPCTKTKDLLMYAYAKELNRMRLDGKLEIDPSTIETLPTVFFSYEKVVDLSYLLVSSLVPPDLLEMVGIPISEHRGIARLPGTACEKAGFGYCSFPAELRFVYSWTDEDTKYSVTGSPVTYRFLISLGRTDLNRELSRMYLEAKYISELDETTVTNYGECIDRLERLCDPPTLSSYLSSVCGPLPSTTLEEINEAVHSSDNNACLAAANLFLGRNGACWNPAEACQRGIQVSSPEEVKECAAERLKNCWKFLADLAKNECRGYLGRLAGASCTLMSALDVTVFLVQKPLQKMSEYVAGALTSLDPHDVVFLAYTQSSPDDICWAQILTDAYKDGKLGGECLDEVNSLYSSDVSPCTNPIASCIITSSIKPVEVSSELCRYTSPAKLRSTFHYNIFDPSYLEVGCYASDR